MKAGDIFSYSFSAIRLRKLRAGLTTLGVVIGIAAIVALLSITQGLQATITRQLQTGFATDTLIVTAGGGLGGGLGQGAGRAAAGGSGFQLFVNATEEINNITDVVKSIAIIEKAGNVTIRNATRYVNMVGVDFAEYSTIYSSTFVAESGEIPLNPGNDTIVVGQRISQYNNGTLFCSAGDTVELSWVNASAYPLPPVQESYAGNVTAVLKEIGGFGVGGPSDSGVYIPISKAEDFFGTEVADTIIVKLKNDDNTTITNVSNAIKAAFFDEVSVTSATAVLSTLSSVFSIIQLFLAGIAAISLLVAGIGIMNIMIVSLMERTREIGILKALGMKSRTVLLAFLSESVIIGLIGAIVGIVLGWGMANVVAIVFGGGGGMGLGNQAARTGGVGGMTLTPVLTPTVFLGALAFGIGVSVIFALYPAWRASKLKPVEALRYE
jgi:putative ABC transport system permease protein